MWRAKQYRRLAFFGGLLLAGLASVECRLYCLQCVRRPELSMKAEALLRVEQPLTPWRGQILTSDGYALAASAPAMAAYADLRLWEARVDQAARLCAPLLGARPRDLKARVLRGLVRAPGGAYGAPLGTVLLKRHVTPEQWQAATNALASHSFGMDTNHLSKSNRVLLARLQRGLVIGQPDQSRVYPFTNLACHVIGHAVDADQDYAIRGGQGVELSFDGYLAGKPGRLVSKRDARGLEDPSERQVAQGIENGLNVHLTIDLALQQMAEVVLAELVARHSPSNAAILVVRPRTGEILAWAAWPGYWPQFPARSAVECLLNRPLWAMIEPGSTFKVFTLAASLSEGIASLDAPLRPGSWEGGVARWSRAGLVVLNGFARSVNELHSELAMRLGPDRFYRHIANFGFGQRTGILLPGESPGWIGALTNKIGSPLTFAGFGHGISVTQLQMVMALCAVVNDGRLMRPCLVSRVTDASGRVVRDFRPQLVRQVLSPAVSAEMRRALQAVVERGGTGVAAGLESHTTGGKTGTAQRAAPHGGYLQDSFYASFMGAFPITNPALVIGVAVDDPKGEHSGGRVAAPAFKRLAEWAAAHLQVPPDKARLGGGQADEPGDAPPRETGGDRMAMAN